MNKKSTVIGIIQARMGSARFPGKMLTPLHGMPLIDWVINRVSKAEKIDKLIVAIPDSEKDDELENHLRDVDTKVFRGSENDVVARFHEVASTLEASHVLRICGDNPFVCPNAIDELVRFFFRNDPTPDYAYNHVPDGNTWPNGLGAEICTMQALSQIHQKATNTKHREHIFDYLKEHPNRFSIQTFDPSDMCLARPKVKLDIDYPEDLAVLASLELRPEMKASDIIGLYEKNPNKIS